MSINRLLFSSRMGIISQANRLKWKQSLPSMVLKIVGFNYQVNEVYLTQETHFERVF